TVRGHPALIREEDYRLMIMPHTPVPAAGRIRFAADVPVLDRSGQLTLLVDGERSFDAVDMFADVLVSTLLKLVDVFPVQDRHRARITFDRLVVARESWLFDAPEMDFCALPDEQRRFLAARAWVRELNLPRHVFVKTTSELKPFFVDFASPLFVEVLA